MVELLCVVLFLCFLPLGPYWVRALTGHAMYLVKSSRLFFKFEKLVDARLVLVNARYHAYTHMCDIIHRYMRYVETNTGKVYGPLSS